MNQGWQCPVCRTVYAPWVAKCEVVHVSVPIVTSTNPNVVPIAPIVPLQPAPPWVGPTGITPCMMGDPPGTIVAAGITYRESGEVTITATPPGFIIGLS